VRADVVAVLAGYGVFKFFDQAHIEMYAAATIVADNMVMMFARFDELKAALSVPQINGLHKPERDKRF
jgi:hypothetical protein